jgi:hypothetical protein
MKGIFIKIINKLGLIRFFNFCVTVTVNKRKIKIPVIKGMGLGNFYRTEPAMIQLLEYIFNKNENDGAFYDIGVNLGQTLVKLKSVSPEMEYLGFEPNPNCVYYVNELIKANHYEKTTVFPFGISDKNSVYELALYSDDQTDSLASIIEDFRPNNPVIKKEYVPCFDMGPYWNTFKLPKIGILKIDVEGAEKEVLESFLDRIIIDKPIIQVEILPVYHEENKLRLKRQEAVEEIIRKMNYHIFRIHISKNGRFLHLEEIEKIGIHTSLDLCEYLLVPDSKYEKYK